MVEVEVGQIRLWRSNCLLLVLRLQLRLLLRLVGRHHRCLLALQLCLLLVGLLRLHLRRRWRSESRCLRVGLIGCLTKTGPGHGHLILVLHCTLPSLLEGSKVVAVLGGKSLSKRLCLRRTQRRKLERHGDGRPCSLLMGAFAAPCAWTIW